VLPEVDWALWHQDTFDRATPRRVEVAGRGLTAGLVALWAHHLLETVQADGSRGFSRFNLWWEQRGESITVTGAWAGQVQLRRWVYGAAAPERKSGDEALLEKVARAHGALLLTGGSSEDLLAAAQASDSRRDFERRLSAIGGEDSWGEGPTLGAEKR
jgi:hypothetical protein